MNRGVRIKLCGLTRRDDVREAVRLGADYIGFVFAPGGPRALTAAQAATLLGRLDTGAARRVGVFRDQPACFINDVIERCGLDFAQLHGHEPRDFPAALQVPVLRVLRVRGLPEAVAAVGAAARLDRDSEAGLGAAPLAPNVYAAMLDAEDAAGQSGGLGRVADPRALAAALRSLPPGTRVFLAGGLTPETVAAAVRAWRPFAVDVSSGIESAPGLKDPARMAAFVAALEGLA